MKIDIVICGHNEALFLPSLFDSFISQTADKALFRILFIDNASTDDTLGIVENFKKDLPLEYHLERKPGKSYALNTGYQLATTEFVAQTDADCKVEKDWVENILKLIQEESPDIGGGRYYPYYPVGKPRWYKDEYNMHDKGHEKKNITDSYLSGSNLFFRRELFLKLKGYNEDFNINPSGIVGGEDTELIMRARKIHPHLKVVYDPSLLVYHATKKKNIDPFFLIKWQWEHGQRITFLLPVNEKQKVRQVLRISKTLARLLFVIIAVLWRDRNRYKYYQNYLFEVVSDHVAVLSHQVAIFNSGFLSAKRS